MKTPYSIALAEYCKTDEYKKSEAELNSKGIKYPYSYHILSLAFAAGWRAMGNSQPDTLATAYETEKSKP